MTIARSSSIQTVRRGLTVTTTVVPIIADVTRMGSDRERRERVGRLLRDRAVRLGGVFPWIADVLGDLPALAGPDVARGARAGRAGDTLNAFIAVEPQSDGTSLLRAMDTPRLLELDLGLLGTLIHLLRPLTGTLSSKLSNAVLDGIAEQARLEADLEQELKLRSELGELTRISLSRLERSQAGLRERPSLVAERICSPTISDLEAMAQAWASAVIESAVILPTLSWRTWWALPDDCFLVRSVAGATVAMPHHQDVVAALTFGSADDARDALAGAVATELGADRQSEHVEHIVDALLAFVDATEGPPRLGPLGVLRAMDRAARSSSQPAQVTRGFMLITRQLAAARTMADELGLLSSPFRRAK